MGAEGFSDGLVLPAGGRGLGLRSPWRSWSLNQCVFKFFFVAAVVHWQFNSAGSALAALRGAGKAGKRKWANEASCSLQIALFLWSATKCHLAFDSFLSIWPQLDVCSAPREGGGETEEGKRPFQNRADTAWAERGREGCFGLAHINCRFHLPFTHTHTHNHQLKFPLFLRSYDVQTFLALLFSQIISFEVSNQAIAHRLNERTFNLRVGLH